MSLRSASLAEVEASIHYSHSCSVKVLRAFDLICISPYYKMVFVSNKTLKVKLKMPNFRWKPDFCYPVKRTVKREAF
jgi:hypothetical protein